MEFHFSSQELISLSTFYVSHIMSRAILEAGFNWSLKRIPYTSFVSKKRVLYTKRNGICPQYWSLVEKTFLCTHELTKPYTQNTRCTKESCLSTDLLQILWRRLILLEISFPHVMLRTVPTKRKGFCARLGPRRKSRSLQGLLESTKENNGSHAFFWGN